MKKAIFAIVLLLGTSLVAAAQYFNVDGISYGVSGEGEVTVYRNNYSGDVVIPETVVNEGKTYKVIGIADQAFMNCNSLTSVSIPNSIRFIGNSAFYYCNSLTSVIIPNSVESLGNYAFFYCENLTTAIIGNGVSVIKESTFFKCYALSNLTIGNSVTSIGSMAFFSCTSLDHVTIPNSVNRIDSEAFESCTALAKVTLGNSLASIGQGAFRECTSLTDINFPNSLTTIGSNAFSQTKITSLALPNSLKEVWDNAFSECTSLTSLSIPANIKEVRCYAFLDCVNLETIRSYVINPDDAYFESYCFMGVPQSTCVVYVPKGSLAAYQDHYIWREFTHIVEMEDGLRGDVNGDGEVTIADVNSLVNAILNDYSDSRFDVNGDHEVTIADINTLIEIILGGGPSQDNHEYVDLGLPSGTLWATCNVGANKPEEYGDYFAWGETAPKEIYTWGTYKWCNGTLFSMTKYCRESENGYEGFTDGKGELDLEDDAAYVNWGSSWRMPTMEQEKELVYECTWEWTTHNGVNGRLVTGPNGKTIFLPAAGVRFGSSLNGDGTLARYLSSNLHDEFSFHAYHLYFNSGSIQWDGYDYRYDGYTVRAVRASHN